MWIRSSFCAADKPQCVEVRVTDAGVEVRDSKLGDDSPIHRYTEDEWNAFIAAAKNGEMDLQALRAAGPIGCCAESAEKVLASA